MIDRNMWSTSTANSISKRNRKSNIKIHTTSTITTNITSQCNRNTKGTINRTS